MTLTKFNPVFPGLATTFFSDLLAEYPSRSQVSPKVDIAENENNFEVHVALPGFKKEAIKVELDENRLTISGERKWEKNEKESGKKYHVVETEYGVFRKTFTLPAQVKANEISADFKDGILELTIPKEVKEARKLQISIN